MAVKPVAQQFNKLPVQPLRLLPRVKECETIRLRFFLTGRPELPSFFGSRHIPEDNRQEAIYTKYWH